MVREFECSGKCQSQLNDGMALFATENDLACRASAGRSPFADVRRGNGGNPQQLKHGCR